MPNPTDADSDGDEAHNFGVSLSPPGQIDRLPQRKIERLAIFGFASTLLCTWESILTSLGFALPNGGTAGLFWNYVIGAIGLGFVYASIAELSSMYPTSGGQYFWVAALAPRSCHRYLSYMTGCLCAFTWQTGIASRSYSAATLVQGLLVLNIKTYNAQKWHGSLLMIAFISSAVVFNTPRRLPMGAFFFFCHIFGILIFIPLLILLPRREAGFPLIEFSNLNGWASNSEATMVGITDAVAPLIGFDCAVHMAGGVKNFSHSVPFTLLVAYSVNVFLGFLALMTCIYTIGPLDQVLDPPTRYPIITMFSDATQNLAVTNFMTFLLIINFTAGTIACIASASQQLWVFAHDHGLPFSTFIVHQTHSFPLNAASLIISGIAVFINIRSPEALRMILSMYNSAFLASYVLTIISVLYHRLRGRKLPRARYSLGKWGILTNVLALTYVIPLFVFSFFPSTPKPTAANMNWAIVIVGATCFLATGYYILCGRKTYAPPIRPSPTMSDEDVRRPVVEVGPKRAFV